MRPVRPCQSRLTSMWYQGDLEFPVAPSSNDHQDSHQNCDYQNHFLHRQAFLCMLHPEKPNLNRQHNRWYRIVLERLPLWSNSVYQGSHQSFDHRCPSLHRQDSRCMLHLWWLCLNRQPNKLCHTALSQPSSSNARQRNHQNSAYHTPSEHIQSHLCMLHRERPCLPQRPSMPCRIAPKHPTAWNSNVHHNLQSCDPGILALHTQELLYTLHLE